jgi:hypothetical protein
MRHMFAGYGSSFNLQRHTFVMLSWEDDEEDDDLDDDDDDDDETPGE